MLIGIDLRVLQVGHEFRGIGVEARQTINEIFRLSANDPSGPHEFALLANAGSDPKVFLDIPQGLRYRELSLGPRPLHSRGGKMRRLWDAWQLALGDNFPPTFECDVLLQYDFALGVPKRPPSVVVIQDVIPLVYQDDFLPSPWPRLLRGDLRTGFENLLRNIGYRSSLRRTIRNAETLVCISDHTRRDLIERLHAPAEKLVTVHLGVSPIPLEDKAGISRVPATMPSKPFLLFIGGADRRRRAIDELVVAFDTLKSRGKDIQLALVGEHFRSCDSIPSPEVTRAIGNSPFKADILTLGYVDDLTKRNLYRSALAFVFPSRYEGFGLPLLEAMAHACPVITYNNSSIPEVVGTAALLADSPSGIVEQTLRLINFSTVERLDFINRAQAHSQAFTWERTAQALYNHIVQAAASRG